MTLQVAVLPDLHGHLDAMNALLKASGFVGSDGKPKRSRMHLVQLGDLIDRGPDSKGCVKRMMALEKAAPTRVHALRGNHEAMVLAAPFEPKMRNLWMSNGGEATLKSYAAERHWLEPEGAHYEWLARRPLVWELDGVLFCHAGLAKSRKGGLDEEGVLWDRPPLERGPYRAVICGHTPTSSGRIESDQGVFRCDLGLGHGKEKLLELLVISVSPGHLDWKIVPL